MQLEEVLRSLEDSGNSSPLRLYLSGETTVNVAADTHEGFGLTGSVPH